jgi:hypothetical protein
LHKYAKRAFILVATLGILYLCGRFLVLVNDQDQMLQMMRDDASDKRIAKVREDQNKEAQYNIDKILDGEIKLTPETQKAIDEMVRATQAQLMKEGYSKKDISEKDIKEKILRLYTGLAARGETGYFHAAAKIA